ncbi:MAG: hypothetical protein LVQ95_02370 [Candidatus Micrarchaeales archaeon]|nr:hypothetical protein [Candidatus Micrarchaeales archaeon]
MFVANSPVKGVSSFPMDENELRLLISKILQETFVKLLESNGLMAAHKNARVMPVGISTVVGGVPVYNKEIIDAALRVKEGLIELRKEVEGELNRSFRGNGLRGDALLKLYEFQYKLDKFIGIAGADGKPLILGVVDHAIKVLSDGEFWRKNPDQNNPLFIPFVVVR